MRPLRALTGIVLGLLTAACAARAPVPTAVDATVYVIQREWHTDIGLATEAVDLPLATLKQTFPGVRFLVFGFGERQFLLGHAPGLAAMLRALLPSRSALLVTALSASPEQAFGPENVIVLRVSHAGLKRIEAAIGQELEATQAGQPVLLADGPYPGGKFYAARDTYDGFYTCNSWTADVLRAGDLPMPAGVLFAGQVVGSARWIAARQAEAAPRSSASGLPAVFPATN